MKISKSTLFKIAAAVAVIAVVWMILKLRKSGKGKGKAKVIVSQMPVFPGPVGYVDDTPLDHGDDNYGVVEPVVAAPIKKEGYGDEEGYDTWQADDAAEYFDEAEAEGFTDYSDVQFKQDLLE